MRKVIKEQMKIGQVPIADIEIDLSSRDEIPKLFMGLKYIYCTPEIRREVFKILEGMIPEGVDCHNGRPGMELWKILVLGTLRLNCNWDYDKLQEIANNHRTLRQMLGHGIMDDDYRYALQTLKDNVSLFTPEVFDRINQVVVSAGHSLIVKEGKESLRGRCDSFVVETDVHYPTDINLLYDAIRKVITINAAICLDFGIKGWRQNRHITKKIKKLFRRCQKVKRSTSKDPEKKAKRDKLIAEAHEAYIDEAQGIIDRVQETIELYRGYCADSRIEEIEHSIRHAERQMAQIRRRVLDGETIDHHEKVFQFFKSIRSGFVKAKQGFLKNWD